MSEPQFIRDGMAVANWTDQYGAILTRATEAHTTFAAAVTSAIGDPGPNTFDRLRAAGRALAAVSKEALATPQTGVAAIDDPRRAALNMFRQAGETIATARMDPTGPHDPNMLRAAELLSQGTVRLNRATAATADLTRRLVAYVQGRGGAV